MKSYFWILKPKIIHYRNFERFDDQKFIADVKNVDFLKQIISIKITHIFS